MAKSSTKFELVERTIWTIGHRPFVFGGSVHYPMGCKVQCTGPHQLGKGFSGYLATAPNGKTFVAEATTGAIVGGTLEQVRADIDVAKVSVMKKQVAEAAERVSKVEITDFDSFWSAMKCNAKPTKSRMQYTESDV